METMKFDEASPAGGGASQGGENNQAPRSGGARNKKLIWAGAVLAALILAVIGWQYWQYTQSPYYQQMKAVKEIEKMAKESDRWGGKTPEETVRLFTEAIKKGDLDLASKYGDPEEIKPELDKIKAEQKTDKLIKWLETGELQEIPGFGGNNFDLVVKENSQEIWILGLFKSDGGTWKIVEF